MTPPAKRKKDSVNGDKDNNSKRHKVHHNGKHHNNHKKPLSKPQKKQQSHIQPVKNTKAVEEHDPTMLAFLPSFQQNGHANNSDVHAALETLKHSVPTTKRTDLPRRARMDQIADLKKRALHHRHISPNQPVIYFKRTASFSHLLKVYTPMLLPNPEKRKKGTAASMTETRRLTIHATGAAIKRALKFALTLQSRLSSQGNAKDNVSIRVTTSTVTMHDDLIPKEDEEEELEDEPIPTDGLTDGQLLAKGKIVSQERQNSAVQIVVERRPASTTSKALNPV